MKTAITVIIVDSRSDRHPDWVEGAIKSVKNQIYKVKLAVVNNIGRKRTIGECWNYAVRQCDTEWILFLGDDDWLSFDYCQMLHNWTKRQDTKHAVCFTTNMTVFREEGGDPYKEFARPCTGIWKRQYLLKHPFNERLRKGVDREYIEEVEKRGDTKILIHYHFGYHYRQHNDYSCAGKISFSYKSAEIYVNSTYPVHTTPIVKCLKEKYTVTVDNLAFESSRAKESRVLWCDWGNVNAVEIGNFDTIAKKILRIHAYEVFENTLHHIPFHRYEKVIFVAEHIRDYAESVLKRRIDNSVIIPNSIDLNGFCGPKSKKKNNKVAYCGELSRKKGLQLMLFIAENFPDFDFHVAGKFNEQDMSQYFLEKKPENVFLEPYSYNLNDFFKDKTYYLQTSPREGCPVTLLQGMSAGLMPVVYDCVGSAAILKGDSFVFSNFEKLESIFSYQFTPELYRQFIEKNYNFKDTSVKYKQLIEQIYVNNESNVKDAG